MSEVLSLSSSSQPLDALIAALARGEAGALRTAYHDHHAHVRAFARRLTGDDAAAEDLVQEVFLALPRAARRFRGDASLRTFLISIALNGARRHVRTAMRRRTAQRRASGEPVPVVPSVAGDPHDVVERRQLAAALSAALDLLPIDQRIAFVLCEVEERTCVEAGALVGVSDGTMRARLFHARKKLQAQLAAWSSTSAGAR